MTNGLPLRPIAAVQFEATLPDLTLIALFRARQRVINTDFVVLGRENGRIFTQYAMHPNHKDRQS